jgi:hypothetical protein
MIIDYFLLSKGIYVILQCKRSKKILVAPVNFTMTDEQCADIILPLKTSKFFF